MSDIGLLTGLAQGVQAGLTSYRQADEQRQKREDEEAERQIRQQQQEESYQLHGYVRDPQTKKLVLSAQAKQEKDDAEEDKILKTRIDYSKEFGADPNLQRDVLAAYRRRIARRGAPDGLLPQSPAAAQPPSSPVSVPPKSAALATPATTNQSLVASNDAGVPDGSKPGIMAAGMMKPAPRGMILSNTQKKEARLEKNQGDLNDIRAKRYGLMEDNAAADVGEKYESDPVLRGLKTQTQALNRADDLINGKTPLTAQTLNAVQQDFINAIAQGGAATEGKVRRELVETYAAKVNELQSKFGSVADVRQAAPELVQNIKDLVTQIKGDYRKAIGEQALHVHSNNEFSTLESKQRVNKKKLKEYSPEAYGEKYGWENPGIPEDEWNLLKTDDQRRDVALHFKNNKSRGRE